eukprot:2274986-Pyramimonas_sp.AAC.1
MVVAVLGRVVIGETGCRYGASSLGCQVAAGVVGCWVCEGTLDLRDDSQCAAGHGRHDAEAATDRRVAGDVGTSFKHYHFAD